MAKDYFQSQEFKEILHAYEQGKDEGRNVYLDADDFADIADYYLNADRPDLATEVTEAGLSIHSDDEVLLIVKSAVFIYQHLYDEAEAVLKELDAENSDVKYQYAQLRYAKYHDTKEAERMWRAWMRIDNGEAPTEEQRRENYIHVISSLVDLCETDYETGDKGWDLEAVRRWVTEYIDLFQPLGTYEADVQLADICRENDLADLMCTVLGQVLEERPYLPKGWSNLGLAQFMLQRYEQALESCDFALAINPNDVESLLTKAHTLHAMGEKETALPVFKEYLDKGGEKVQIIPYAETLFLVGEKEEAVRQLELLADHFERQKQEDDRKWAKADSLPQEEKLENMMAHEAFIDLYVKIFTDIGDLYHHNGYYEESLGAYDRVLAIDPQCAEAHFMLGINQLGLARYEEASRSFAQALQWAEDQVMMGIDIALTFVLNDFDSFALEVLNAVGQIADRSNSPFSKNVAAAKSITYLKMGHTNQFLKHFKVACQKTPELVQNVYGNYFPESMPVSQWAEYAAKNIDALMKKFQKEDFFIKGFS